MKHLVLYKKRSETTDSGWKPAAKVVECDTPESAMPHVWGLTDDCIVEFAIQFDEAVHIPNAIDRIWSDESEIEIEDLDD